MAKDNKDETYFEYLDSLRESGVTNMFGAPRYLQEVFGLTKQDSFNVFQRWMETFEGRTRKVGDQDI